EFTLILRATGAFAADEVTFSPSESSEGGFQMRVPSGMYQAAIASDACGTRLRSGIVVKPGMVTDLGSIVCEPAVSLSFRVLDARTAAAVQGARVLWDPPDALNARDARIMYARRWSARTDRRGTVMFQGGPCSHSGPVACRSSGIC